MDFHDYAADTSNGLFLSDLYKAVNDKTEAAVFENIEKASMPQLDILYQLLTEGTYKLSRRYMMANGSLVEATGTLNTELISDIGANGKFFVFTTTVSQAKILSFLGNKIVKELGDIITLDPIMDDQIKNLAYTLCINMANKCRDHLHVLLNFDESLVRELSTHYRSNHGIKDLAEVKEYVLSLENNLKVQQLRAGKGLKSTNLSMHMIFAGNPGTGKTMMARTVANVLYNLNVIQTNKLIETDRSGLVAGYVGQTALKTRRVIESALGGVLFVDEAYSLAQGGKNDFGQEAIDTLVKMMDDNRDQLVVILAGYSEDMRNFLNRNAGLQSRFANIIEFPDYNTDELMQIAENMYADNGYVLAADSKVMLREKFAAARLQEKFGNGRYVRNVFEKSINNQALRLSGTDDISKDALITITKSDIQEV